MISARKRTNRAIKRQIEQILGLQPADPNEADVEAAKQAVYKHPDLPDKVAQVAGNPLQAQPPPLPVTAQPPPSLTPTTAAPAEPPQIPGAPV